MFMERALQYHYNVEEERKEECMQIMEVDNRQIANGQGNYVDFTKVVFNFVEATSLTIAQTPLVGTVLAPFAGKQLL